MRKQLLYMGFYTHENGDFCWCMMGRRGENTCGNMARLHDAVHHLEARDRRSTDKGYLGQYIMDSGDASILQGVINYSYSDALHETR